MLTDVASRRRARYALTFVHVIKVASTVRFVDSSIQLKASLLSGLTLQAAYAQPDTLDCRNSPSSTSQSLEIKKPEQGSGQNDYGIT